MEKTRAEQITDIFRKFSEHSLSDAERVSLFKAILDAYSIPYPPQNILKILATENRLNILFNYLRFQQPSPRSWDEHHERLKSRRPKKRKSYARAFHSYRSFDARGVYPSRTFETKQISYFFDNGRPRLVTRYRTNEEMAFSDKSELHYLNRWEVIFGVAVTCACKSPDFLIYFENDLRMGVPADIIRQLKDPALFFSENLRINHGLGLSWSNPLKNESPYTLTSIDISDDFYEIYENYASNNHLLLRTSLTYLKAKMLWRSDMFHEDALFNLFMTIEGCLVLIFRKRFPKEKNFNIQKAKDIIAADFPQGTYIVELLTEGYEKRIQIAHAESKYTSSWTPTLSYDDYELYDWYCKLFLNYIIREKFIPNE